LAVIAAPLQQEGATTEEHSSEGAAEHAEEEPSALEEAFHWFNFLLIVGGIAYMVKKLLVPFLEERGKLIRQDMDHSAKMLADAEQRLATVEGKLKGLDEELAALRQAAFRESVAERERIEQASASDAAKVLAAAEQEIDASVKAARQQLKQYAAELAVGVAESKIRASLTPQSEKRMLEAFAKELASGGAPEKKN
jgi:F0F1-type ATP synthase membrane subunit b/b'